MGAFYCSLLKGLWDVHQGSPDAAEADVVYILSSLKHFLIGHRKILRIKSGFHQGS